MNHINNTKIFVGATGDMKIKSVEGWVTIYLK